MHRALVVCHGTVLGAVAAVVLSFHVTPASTVWALLIATTPLTVAIKGLLMRATHTHLWLAIAMVFYVGAGLVETIASRAESPSAILLLLASTVELALLLGSLRRARPASRGSAES